MRTSAIRENSGPSLSQKPAAAGSQTVQAKAKRPDFKERESRSEQGLPQGNAGTGASFGDVTVFPDERPSGRDRGGSPLPGQLRQEMESTFGADFSDVRVHQGPDADSLSAIAFTQGRDIHFSPGSYNPSTPEGQQIIAHELAHVVQQRQGRVAAPSTLGAPVNQDPSLESEADVLGERAVSGLDINPPATGSRNSSQSGSQGHPIQLTNRYPNDRHSKRYKTRRKKDWRERRDRKLEGRSAGPLSEIAESRTKLPLRPEEVEDLPQQGMVDPHRIRTAQSNMVDSFSDGARVMDTARDLSAFRRQQENPDREDSASKLDDPRENIPPIEIYRRGNKAYTLDHRRLQAHRRANISARYQIADSNRADKDFMRKFSSKDEGMSMKVLPSAEDSVPYSQEDLYGESDPEEEFYQDEDSDSGEENDSEFDYESDEEWEK